MSRVSTLLLLGCLLGNDVMADDIVFRSTDGVVLRLSDLAGTSAEASPNRANIPTAAGKFFDDGVQLGKSGRYRQAVEKFNAAIKLAPNWPYPHYQRAFTMMLHDDATEALASYRKVDELEPRGFFTSKQTIYTLERELDGRYPKGLYLYFLSHEWKEEVAEKIKIMRSIIQSVPDYAPAYQKLAYFEQDGTKKLELLETALTFDTDAETRGMLLLNKATRLNIRGEKGTATRILGELVLDRSTTKTVSAWAKALLRQMYE